MGDEVTTEQLREAVTHEVRQQMTPIYLKVDRAVEDIKQLRWTVYGNRETEEDGLVQDMHHIKDALNKLVDEGKQRKWLQVGILIGLGLNFAQSTGILPAVEHVLKAMP